MGGALIRALSKAEEPENIFIFDHSREKTAALSEETGCIAAGSAAEAVSRAGFVFLCVKPKVLPATVKELAPTLKACAARGEEQVIVSIAAGVSIAKLMEMLEYSDLELPVIRLMPNTPVAVGKGLVLVMPSQNVAQEDVSQLMDALSHCGSAELFDEKLVDAATPVFSCSPAYAYMFIEAMADGGVMAGVPRAQAQRFAAQAMLGAAAMVLDTGKHPGQLKDEVCSPGGSTIVGVETLENCGFRAAVAQAVYNAYQRTMDLGK